MLGISSLKMEIIIPILTICKASMRIECFCRCKISCKYFKYYYCSNINSRKASYFKKINAYPTENEVGGWSYHCTVLKKKHALINA